jgi:hypothetical protein
MIGFLLDCALFLLVPVAWLALVLLIAHEEARHP